MKLEFLDPVHKPGKNVTVRLGTKWVENAVVGQVLTAVRTGKEEGIDVVVSNVYCKPFDKITEDEISNEHAPDCRNIHGLKVAMVEAYGDKFTERSMVTILEYIPLS